MPVTPRLRIPRRGYRPTPTRGNLGTTEPGRAQEGRLHHPGQKAIDDEATERWLQNSQQHLDAAIKFFGENANLEVLTPKDLNRWIAHLRAQKGRGGKTLAEGTIRKYVNSLSNLYARAVSDHGLPRNPVRDMYSKPTPEQREAAYLEPAEVALLLESARTYQPTVDTVRQAHGGAISAKANAHVFPFIAALALTGVRFSECAGLLVDDVSLKLGKIYIRENQYRRLKTKGSKRWITLWPQLREILEQYFTEREATGGLGTLLFPGRAPKPKKGEPRKELMVTDVRKALDKIAKRAGLPPVRPHALRHSYCAARIQTCDRGRPVALYSVARELGALLHRHAGGPLCPPARPCAGRRPRGRGVPDRALPRGAWRPAARAPSGGNRGLVTPIVTVARRKKAPQRPKPLWGLAFPPERATRFELATLSLGS